MEFYKLKCEKDALFQGLPAGEGVPFCFTAASLIVTVLGAVLGALLAGFSFIIPLTALPFCNCSFCNKTLVKKLYRCNGG